MQIVNLLVRLKLSVTKTSNQLTAKKIFILTMSDATAIAQKSALRGAVYSSGIALLIYQELSSHLQKPVVIDAETVAFFKLLLSGGGRQMEKKFPVLLSG